MKYKDLDPQGIPGFDCRLSCEIGREDAPAPMLWAEYLRRSGFRGKRQGVTFSHLIFDHLFCILI